MPKWTWTDTRADRAGISISVFRKLLNSRMWGMAEIFRRSIPSKRQLFHFNFMFSKVPEDFEWLFEVCWLVLTSGGPLSALTRCVNARLLSAIKKISPLIYSQSWVGSWVYTTHYDDFHPDILARMYTEPNCTVGARTSLRTRGSQSVMDRLLTAGLCGNTIGQDIQTLTYHSSTSNMAFHLKDVCSSNVTWPLNMMLT